MPDNRKALIRYKVLDKCFRDKYKKYYIEDLMDEVNEQLKYVGLMSVSKKQIYDDIRYMESSEGWEAPIERYQDGKRKYLRYNRDFSIMETPITEMEMEQLQTLITSLSRFQGLPLYDWVEGLLSNLRERLGTKDVEKRNYIGFEQNRELKGLRFLSDLINCVMNHQSIIIDYHPFGKEVLQWTIHPYYLKQYNNRWFLFGYNPEFGDLSIVPLDRIELISNSEQPFKENSIYNFGTYFNNIIGISKEKGRCVEHIRLRFTSNRFPYVVSKPIHHSQKIENEKERIITLNVIPNKELVSELIWFRDDVEVLSPDSLREEIKGEIANMYKKYFGVKNDFTKAQ
mgnify:CR=1 FL=1